MFFDFVGSIILSAILAFVAYYIFLWMEDIFEIICVEEEPEFKYKFGAVALNTVCLYISHKLITALGIFPMIYKLLPSRLNNGYMEAVLFVLITYPIMLIASRLILRKFDQSGHLAYADINCILACLKFIPLATLGVALLVGLGYFTFMCFVPFALIMAVLSFFGWFFPF